MDARINYFGNGLAGKVMRHLNSAGQVVAPALPVATQELVKIRASQINGCGFCTDMHTKDAAAAGETQLRLNLVATWREATVFTRGPTLTTRSCHSCHKLRHGPVISGTAASPSLPTLRRGRPGTEGLT
jgi:AhpD family alkylhydroperoxidase